MFNDFNNGCGGCNGHHGFGGCAHGPVYGFGPHIHHHCYRPFASWGCFGSILRVFFMLAALRMVLRFLFW